MPWPEEFEFLFCSQLPISITKKRGLETMCKKLTTPEEYHDWIRGLKIFNGNLPRDPDE